MAKIGLVLTGGGARGAYQAGVLKALAEIIEESGEDHPIKVLTGLSAGAINVAFLACYADDWIYATRELCRLWMDLTPESVYRSDVASLTRIGYSWLRDVTLGSLKERKLATSLLDNSPLETLLNHHLDFARMRKNIDSGLLEALVCTAFDYDRSLCVCFTEGKDVTPWRRPKRCSESVQMNVRHVMASSAIPVVFPPTQFDRRFFGDGTLRNTAPISPAVNLGADKIIILGVRNPQHLSREATPHIGRPTLARVFGLMLNSLFFDATDSDVDRLNHINRILMAVGLNGEDTNHFKIIRNVWIRPSVDLGQLAAEAGKALPRPVSYLLGGLGNSQESADLASYLLFEKGYASQLVDIGYKDGIAHRNDLLAFIRAD